MDSEVIFFFDTEDFTSNYAANAIRDLANLLRAEGVKGNFMVVGLLAEQLAKWGRDDVFEALSHHEIHFHSYGHTLHPTINEYTDKEDFNEAYKELIAQETVGLEMVKKHLKTDKIYAAVPPGNSMSYVAMYGYSDMGIPCYANSPLETSKGSMYFCNALHLDYVVSLESIFYDNRYSLEEVIKMLSGRKRSIIYTHPNRVLYKDFWDDINYNKENLHEFGDWEEPEKEPFFNVKKYYEGLRALIRALKNDIDFEITTISEVCEKEGRKPLRTVKKADAPAILESLRKKFYPTVYPLPCLSISDCFNAAVAFLNGEEEYTALKNYGFLEEPIGVNEEVTVKKSDIINAAKDIDTKTFLPAKIRVGEYFIGPYDFLIAALEVLSGEGDSVQITVKPQQFSLDEFPLLRDITFKNTWMHSDSFEDNYIGKRLRLQAWTIRNV